VSSSAPPDASAHSAAPIIATQGLVKQFKDIQAVAGLDLRVPAGGVYGFLGPNGAGKTTTIRMLLALVRPTRGSVTLFEEPVAPGRPVLDRVGALVERPALYPYLSAADNLRLVAPLVPGGQAPHHPRELLGPDDQLALGAGHRDVRVALGTARPRDDPGGELRDH
jgi:ABC-2 type transport system ATP-binding protein